MGSLSLAAPHLPAIVDAGPKSPLVQEWNPTKRWNPFNSHKLLAHVPRWRQIRRSRPLPPPVMVTVDPTNVCNLNCVWFNAGYIRAKRHNSLSAKTLLHLADFLPRWGDGHAAWPPGVEAVCVAGGGEPLLNPATAGRCSIIIPVFNNLELTQACLKSIQENTAPGSYEIIVVDNGSTDGTRDFCREASPPGS